MVNRFVLAAPLFALGCSIYSSVDEPSVAAPPPETTTPPVVVAPGVAPPSPRPIAHVASSTETVFAHEDGCDATDVPNVPATAVRAKNGTVILAAGNAPKTWLSTGPDLGSVKRHCAAGPAFISGANESAAALKPYQWLGSLYRTGDTIHALVQDEFHDPSSLGCTHDDPTPTNPCSYSFISYASSGTGLTFTQPPSPAHLVAPFPEAWQPPPNATYYTTPPPPPPEGYTGPSNIVHAPDGLYYAAFRVDDGGTSSTCIMRTTDVGNPQSWVGYHGGMDSLVFTNPYSGSYAIGLEAKTTPDVAALCTPVSRDAIGSLHESLRYSTFFERYILVGAARRVDPADGTTKCGAWFSLSNDFVTWEPAHLLAEGACDTGAGAEIAHPSLIDPADTTDSFENVGKAPYLYYATRDHDLVRVAITFDYAQ